MILTKIYVQTCLSSRKGDSLHHCIPEQKKYGEMSTAGAPLQREPEE